MFAQQNEILFAADELPGRILTYLQGIEARPFLQVGALQGFQDRETGLLQTAFQMPLLPSFQFAAGNRQQETFITVPGLAGLTGTFPIVPQNGG